MTNLMDQWRVIIAQSWEPREWFQEGMRPRHGQSEGLKMWVYRGAANGMYEVGYYNPQGQWVMESEHTTAEDAANRVRWLNGGSVA